MRISTRGRYALRLMVDLAAHADDGYTSVKSISQREEISEKYLEQIITILSRAEFVTGVRGPSGGYKLCKDPKEYTVGMILRKVEGNLSPVSCVDDVDNYCPRKERCVTINVWKQVKEAVAQVVDSITLEDLKRDYLEKRKEQ